MVNQHQNPHDNITFKTNHGLATHAYDGMRASGERTTWRTASSPRERRGMEAASCLNNITF
jgi:hypothetical protein